MKKSTKGLIAAGAAGVLLLGGAGTLAFWTDDTTVEGGELESGSITLSSTDCSTAVWKHTENDLAADLLVPGDSVYKECTVTLVMEGDHMDAELEIDPDSLPAAYTETSTGTDMDSELSAPTIKILDAPGGAEIDSVDGPGTVNATVRIDIAWAYGTEKNDSQLATVELNDIGILATQTHDPL